MTIVTFQTADKGIAREQALLAAGRPAILLWQAREQALVVPAAWAGRDAVRATEHKLAEAGWPLLARTSGGGAVPQGPCTLNLALVAPLPAGSRIEDGYALICGAVSEALSRFEVATGTGAVPGAFCDGSWNVISGGRKLAGTAQRWRSMAGARTALLHAAILTVPPSATVWPALALLHHAVGLVEPPRSESHMALSQLLPPTMRPTSVAGALLRAAEDRLSRLLTHRQQAA